jgi:hypothetical protein
MLLINPPDIIQRMDIHTDAMVAALFGQAETHTITGSYKKLKYFF